VKCTVYASFLPSTAPSRWLPVKSRHFRVTFGHLRSCDVIFTHVTASSCELQPCRKWNVQYSQLSAFYSHTKVTSSQMTSLAGHFRSPEVTWRFLPRAASSCELHPCRKWNVQYTPVFSLPQPLPGDFHSNDFTLGSLPVNWGHATAFPVTWLPPPAIYSLVWSEMYSIRRFSAFHSHLQVSSVQMTSFSGHFLSPEVKWCHLSGDCLFLRATAL